MGGLRISVTDVSDIDMLAEPKGAFTGFLAKANIQNYDDKELVEKFFLRIGDEKNFSQSKMVTIGSWSTGVAEFQCYSKQHGIFNVSLSTPGQETVSERVVLPYLDLSGQWLFNEGDDLSWAKPSWNDSSWQKVQLPAHWEDHSNYTADNVYGWYRRKIIIPAAWKGHAILLPVGKIDDTDATYFNGKKIGQTGEFPPNFKGEWDKPRKYEVPAKLIHFGKENMISIRVFDAYGGGGLYDGPLGPIEVK